MCLCPRCGKNVFKPKLYSLFFPVQICKFCDNEERKGIKRTWHTHPDIAQYEQESNTSFQSVRRTQFSQKALICEYPNIINTWVKGESKTG